MLQPLTCLPLCCLVPPPAFCEPSIPQTAARRKRGSSNKRHHFARWGDVVCSSTPRPHPPQFCTLQMNHAHRHAYGACALQVNHAHGLPTCPPPARSIRQRLPATMMRCCPPTRRTAGNGGAVAAFLAGAALAVATGMCCAGHICRLLRGLHCTTFGLHTSNRHTRTRPSTRHTGPAHSCSRTQHKHKLASAHAHGSASPVLGGGSGGKAKHFRRVESVRSFIARHTRTHTTPTTSATLLLIVLILCQQVPTPLLSNHKTKTSTMPRTGSINST